LIPEKEIDDFLQGLHPSEIRAIAYARDSLSKGTAAFLIGAGFDIAVAPGSSGLIKLVTSLLKWKGIPPEWAQKWPAELAMMARYQCKSNDDFKHELEVLLTKKDSWGQSRIELCDEFESLFSKTNLIVTLNYSEVVDEAIRKSAERTNRIVEILDREDLPSFNVPNSLVPNKGDNRIFLIHLHGRCSKMSEPILDAWGYNIVNNSDPFYEAFLEQLFTERDVISFGVSWEDVPLRNAAALVRRTKGYVGRTHLAFRFIPESKNPPEHKDTLFTKIWANSMRAAYGLVPIETNETTQILLLKELSQPDKRPKLKVSSYEIKEIAAYLDSCGDYESPQQSEWLQRVGIEALSEKGITESEPNAIQYALSQVSRLILNMLKNDPKYFWVYHFYLYDLKEQGRELYFNIADAALRLDPSDIALADERLCLDFLIGAIEYGDPVKAENLSGVYPRLAANFQKRFSLAEQVWINVETNRNELAEKLLDLGWESIAGKVMLDDIKRLVDEANEDDSPDKIVEIQNTLERSEAVSRMAGATRRRIKADVLSAMWDPRPREGRHRILGALKRSELEGKLEPGLFSALFAGLVICHARSLKKELEDPRIAQILLDAAKESGFVTENTGSQRSKLSRKQAEYWQGLVPKEYIGILLKVAALLPG
jgi:hypothetical protein